MQSLRTEACDCEVGEGADCKSFVDGPPYTCVNRMARHGSVKTDICDCTTGHSWHFNDTCLRCNPWIKETLVLIDRLPLYLKAMGSRCYDKDGITFPNLDYGRVQHHFVDERVAGIKGSSTIVEVSGQIMIDRMLDLMGARGIEWHKPWPNMPPMAFFRRLVDRSENDVDKVCDEASEVLYSLGLIIRPAKDWVP